MTTRTSYGPKPLEPNLGSQPPKQRMNIDGTPEDSDSDESVDSDSEQAAERVKSMTSIFDGNDWEDINLEDQETSASDNDELNGGPEKSPADVIQENLPGAFKSLAQMGEYAQRLDDAVTRKKAASVLNAGKETLRGIQKQATAPQTPPVPMSERRAKPLKPDVQNASTPSGQATTLDPRSRKVYALIEWVRAALQDTRPTAENSSELSTCIEETEKAIKSLSKASGSLPDHLTEAKSELELQLGALTALKKKFDEYQNPFEKGKRLDESRLYTDAACEIFKSLLDNVPPQVKSGGTKDMTAFDTDAKALLNILSKRSKLLLAYKEQSNSNAQSQGNDSTPHTSSKLIKQILAKHERELESVAPDDIRHESDLMADIIDAFLQAHPGADSRSGKRLLALAKASVLNEHRDWGIIECDVLVPVLDPAAALAPVTSENQSEPAPVIQAKINCVTTPAGHVFNKDGLVVRSTDSPITQESFEEYQQPSSPGNPTKIITTGRNSHSTTEHMHGVNVARTEAYMGNKQLFGGTRHGTLSGYELYPDTLQTMSDKRLEKIATDLISQGADTLRISTDPDAENTDGSGRAKATKKLTSLDQAWADYLSPQSTTTYFLETARSDEKFCALLRRKVALNRAREVFLSEVLSNPAMLERIKRGDSIHFNAISLITPDPFRNFLAKLMPSKFRRHDELTMRREEMQAWKDLEEELTADRLVIDNQPVKAEINSFSVGVNQLALESGNWLVRALTSGWNMVAEENRLALTRMIGDPLQVSQGTYGGQLGNAISEREKSIGILEAQKMRAISQRSAKAQIEQIEKDLENARIDLAEMKDLGRQLAEMWQSGAYRHAGDQPYKFAARLALLSSRMNGGTAFNCKSGKDRTAQLDLEIKLLAVQCESRRIHPGLDGTGSQLPLQTVPPPYEGRTDFEKHQLQAFIFQDESRTVMQRYNTGVEGSKLNYWKALYDSFISADDPDPKGIGHTFRGRSEHVPS